jgi:hypothetical protein
MIMVRVDAVTMRVTREALPRYGASSCLRNSQSQVKRPVAPDRLCAMAPISTASNDDDGRLTEAKQLGRRVLHTDTDRIS